MEKIKIGLYGDNGHQIWFAFQHPGAEIVAAAGIAPEKIPAEHRSALRFCDSLDELLQTDAQLISLCSPLRSEQARHALRCLEAGRHVYAEKPCAFREEELDEIIRTSRRVGRRFHEMASVAFQAPYAALRKCVAAGTIGEVLQVVSQKSYPWRLERPADEHVDGGLIRQVGIYNLRFIEHLTGLRVTELFARETRLGNQGPQSECRRAVSFSMALSNGAIASGVSNYAGPCAPHWNSWGYENVRIFGVNGFVESVNGGETVRYYTPEQGVVPLDPNDGAIDWFDTVLDEIRTGEELIPVPLETELSPTRWVIRAGERPLRNLTEREH
ncbi:MAG TPA: Gfo/Idh/MocA family oxidoreductase [Victivallis vadensis]|uniref:Gfo/Idh/MocA family protein n=1 Tax=Victivallis vadensis TaxID=172901 RepID=UPI001D4F095F|nr:Gfo/Idh/MocA family oxidoreductase [Victivallis vadensis]HJH04214.1 Gfo/Idh/MocA family oxidoreductase [Victivallis vadensis]